MNQVNFLSSFQIKGWYSASLQLSGFKELDALPKAVWMAVVLQGKRALPPGFLGNFIERLTHKTAGIHSGTRAFPLEDGLMDKICIGTGFEHLEGVFILAGAKCDPRFFSGVIEQVMDRIPGFFNPLVNFSDKDLDAAMREIDRPEPPVRESRAHPGGRTGIFFADRESSVLSTIETIYREVLEHLERDPFRLNQADLFEIGHPSLFEKPADRTFYRVMMRAVKGIATWAGGVFTLREETPVVVSHFGEPQMLPLGGYDSLTNKGDISSLVPSELAFIDEAMPVDMFDYKFLENQLMYFKREQGAVFRIRRRVHIQVELTSFMEHERHLGMFFAWCLILSDKILDAFTKDIVEIQFEFMGFEPTAMKDALEFFRHFLREKGNADRVTVEITSGDPVPPKISKRHQCWILGRIPFSDMKHVDLAFPQNDDFASRDEGEQEKHLGMIISGTLERMVVNAYR